MKLSFVGMDKAIDFGDKDVVVVQVLNEALFARCCQALISGKGENAIEPYSIWDNRGEEVRPQSMFIPIVNPFEIPWKHKSLMGAITTRVEGMLKEDEDKRNEIQRLSFELERVVKMIGLQLHADYSFKVEWALKNYMKAFGFDVDIVDDAPLLDNLLTLIEVAHDAQAKEAFLFVNLKTFLTKKELEELYDALFFHGISALLLENHDAATYSDFEKKIVIDRDFVEYKVAYRSEGSSLLQGRICSNGFGAVTF